MTDQTTDQSIFESTTSVSAPAGDSSLAVLVGEGRKYRSEEELAKAYLAADEFVEKLKAENKAYREELAKARTMDEVLEAIKTAPPADSRGTESNHTNVGVTSAEQIVRIVQEQLTGYETSKSRRENIKTADRLMKAEFGEKASELYKLAADTPEKHEAFMKLAEVSPEQFVKLFKQSNNTIESPATGGSSVNTASLSQRQATDAEAGTKLYYEKMRRENPKQYYSQAIQLEIHRAAKNDPDKYWGRKH